MQVTFDLLLSPRWLSVAGCGERFAHVPLLRRVLAERFGSEAEVEPLAQLLFRLRRLLGRLGHLERHHGSYPRLHRVPIGVDVEHDGLAVGREVDVAQQILHWELEQGLERKVHARARRRRIVRLKVHLGGLVELGALLHLTWRRALRRWRMNAQGRRRPTS